MPWWGWVIYGVAVALGIGCIAAPWLLDTYLTGRDHE
jgi:hypothetical protein